MSDESQQGDFYNFPRRINDPTLIAIFPIKQILPTVFILIVGTYSGAFWPALLGSALTFWSIGKVLKNSYFDVIIHKYWAKGLLDVMVGFAQTRTVVNPLVKRFYS
jgi:hypothetical protein